MPRSNDDLRFNRVSKRGRRIYLNEYVKGRNVGDHRYEGLIKCKAG